MNRNLSSVENEGSEAGLSGGRGCPKLSEWNWLCADAECAHREPLAPAAALHDKASSGACWR